MILLSGGTDGGDRAHIAHNARMLQKHLPQIPVIVAVKITPPTTNCVKFSARAQVYSQSEAIFTDNVLPEVNRMHLEPARNCIRDLFLRRIVHARGLGPASKPPPAS